MTTSRGSVASLSRDFPAVRAVRRDQHIGHHRGFGRAAEAPAGLGVVAPQFGEHVGEIFIVDIAHPLEPGEFALRDQIEIVDQPRHAGVVAVRLARLQRETFAQGARAHAGGIERLDQVECAFDLGERDAELVGTSRRSPVK